jgi:D-sedoheptulose 7-phosphate isomerase
MTIPTKAIDYLNQTYRESEEIRRHFLENYGSKLLEGSEAIGKSFKAGGKLLIAGNGGSAADAQHMAAEMIGRMLMERRPLPALALTTDSSNLTAVGNDYGFEYVFSKQVQGLGRRGDVLLAISTSGNSKNILLAVEEAKKIGMTVIGLTGGSGGELMKRVDIGLCAELGKNSSRIQETHLFAVHSLVDLLDRFYLN